MRDGIYATSIGLHFPTHVQRLEYPFNAIYFINFYP